MMIEPWIRDNVCLNAHPQGCFVQVRDQIRYVTQRGPIAGPRRVLVIGAFVCFAIIGVPSKLLGLNEMQLSVVRWGIAAIITAREVYMTVIRQIAEARGINFAATAAGKVKMALQSFAIGTVVIKTAHVPATWGDWFTIVVFILTAMVTIGSAFPVARGGQRFPF